MKPKTNPDIDHIREITKVPPSILHDRVAQEAIGTEDWVRKWFDGLLLDLSDNEGNIVLDKSGQPVIDKSTASEISAHDLIVRFSALNKMRYRNRQLGQKELDDGNVQRPANYCQMPWYDKTFFDADSKNMIKDSASFDKLMYQSSNPEMTWDFSYTTDYDTKLAMLRLANLKCGKRFRHDLREPTRYRNNDTEVNRTYREWMQDQCKNNNAIKGCIDIAMKYGLTKVHAFNKCCTDTWAIWLNRKTPSGVYIATHVSGRTRPRPPPRNNRGVILSGDADIKGQNRRSKIVRNKYETDLGKVASDIDIAKTKPSITVFNEPLYDIDTSDFETT